jgi:uncharacterized membrane protein (DUF2068 family)
VGRLSTVSGRRWNSETLVCGVRGHYAPATGVRTLLPEHSGIGVDLPDGRRFARCLRCDMWIAAAAGTARTAERESLPKLESLDVPRRGKLLRDAIIVRLIAIDRAIHAVIFGSIAVGSFLALQKFPLLKAALQRWLVAIDQAEGQIGPTPTRSFADRELRHLLAVRSGSLRVVAITAAVYCVLEATEAVGLWEERRWAEYLTAVATAGFLPFEIIELTRRVTPLKVTTLAINLAILVYLIWAKRLFGVGRLRNQKQELAVEDVRALFGPESRGTPFVREPS